jgi:AcrR family transcriptional regulator
VSEDKYHHGDLKQKLIINGIKLLNDEGSENFSMRKLASLCNVSHAAPYKHFKSKDEIITAILQYVLKELENSLRIIEKKYKDNLQMLTLELGRQYVLFMVKNPDYLKILFLSDFETKIMINNGEINSEYEAFNILKNNAIKAFKMSGIKEDEYARNIVAMWAMVHGIAIMIANKTVVYDGDISIFVEEILKDNMKF